MSTIKLMNCYAPWCGYSKSLMPVWEQLETKYQDNSNVEIAKVDCDADQETGAKYGVSGYPTILLFKNGSDTPITYKGDRSLHDLESFIKEHNT